MLFLELVMSVNVIIMSLDSQCHTLTHSQSQSYIADECFGLVSVKLVVGLYKRYSTCLAVRA